MSNPPPPNAPLNAPLNALPSPQADARPAEQATSGPSSPTAQEQLSRVLIQTYGDLGSAALDDLVSSLAWLHLTSGDMLFRQGDAADAMYIIVRGRLRFEARDAGDNLRLAGEMGRGETVGELALLTGEGRSASVSAIRDSALVKLTRAQLEQIIQQHPQAMMQLMRTIAGRATRGAQVARVAKSTATTFALLPLSADVPLADFTQRLSQALAEHGSTLALTRNQVDARFSQDSGPAKREPSGDLSGWLGDQEMAHQFVLYQAEAGWSPWTQRCVRQADRVVLVANADGDPEPGATEIALTQRALPLQTELVRLHPAATAQPQGTLRWLSPRTLHAHHHVRLERESDVQRLARALAGRSVGVVLSSGGARGYAFGGAAWALEDADIPRDVLGGTSMGGLAAGILASGWSRERLAGAIQLFASPRALLDYTLPIASLAAGAKITNMLRDLFGDTQIEDLWTPYFCVSSNLSRGEPLVHRTGPLWRAIRASIAIPGIFAPVAHEGDVLVDGAIFNNFPADIMRDIIGEGTLIGVDVVNHAGGRNKGYDFGASISGWRVLWSRLNPLMQRQRVPSIFNTLMRSTETHSRYRGRELHALVDLLIQPNVGRFGALDFGEYDAISQIGYETAREWIEVWRQEGGSVSKKQ